MFNIENIDALIKMINCGGSNDAAAPELFIVSNALIYRAVTDLSDVINKDGAVTLDIADMRALFFDAGMTLIVSSTSSGIDRSRCATDKAIAKMLLKDVNVTSVRRFLISITSANSLKLKEVVTAIKCVKSAAAEKSLIVTCTAVNESMGDEIRVTVFEISFSSPPTALPRIT